MEAVTRQRENLPKLGQQQRKALQWGKIRSMTRKDKEEEIPRKINSRDT